MKSKCSDFRSSLLASTSFTTTISVVVHLWTKNRHPSAICKFLWGGYLGLWKKLGGILFLLLHFYDQVFKNLFRGYMRPPSPHQGWNIVSPGNGLFVHGTNEVGSKNDQDRNFEPSQPIATLIQNVKKNLYVNKKHCRT
jgi:hypothetical protein